MHCPDPYITDIFTDIVNKVSERLLTQLQAVDAGITGVHFEYGHYNVINQRLMEKSATRSQKFDRYPLICLFQDFPVQRGKVGLYGKVRLQMICVYQSETDVTSEKRVESVFKPIIQPIYEELLYQIVESGAFTVMTETGIAHDKVDRPHWGDPGIYGNTGYILTDVLDGIELRNLELTAY